MAKYGGLAKLYLEVPEPESNKSTCDQKQGQLEELIKVECHRFENNTFCTGATFVPKPGNHDEDDGWVITFVHSEDTNLSKVRQFCSWGGD